MNTHAPSSPQSTSPKTTENSSNASQPHGFSGAAAEYSSGPLAFWTLQPTSVSHTAASGQAAAPNPGSLGKQPVLQRTPDTGAAPPATSTPAPAASSVIINDSQTAAPGQMRRSEFIASLRQSVTDVCDAELAEVGRDTNGCPYLAGGLAAYETKSAAEVEQTLRQYVGTGADTAAGLIGAAISRVRAAVRIWKMTGLITGLPNAPGNPGDSSPVQSKPDSANGDGRPGSMSPVAIQHGLGGGTTLEPRLRADMEQRFGSPFSDVRVHTDHQAGILSKQHAAKAFTVGNHVAFAPGQYRPDTLDGKLLIAHELAHTIQQSTGHAHAGMSGAMESRFEQDADRAVMNAMLESDLAPTSGLQSSGLQFQACSDKEKPKPLFEQLKNETDAYTLATAIGRITDTELTELAGKASATSALARAIQWEQAWRGRQWSKLAQLARSKGEGFVEVYIDRVVDLIAAGGLSIRIDTSDPGFAGWAKGQLRDLGHGPVGFRLIVELLATGQTVELKGTTGGHETERVMPDSDPDAGRLVTSGPDGKPLPPNQQRRGAPTGSRITFNPNLAENQTTVGLGPDGKPTLIHSDPTVTFGHELIHALHNARGENVAPPPGVGVISRVMGQPNFLVRNPVTGRTENPEELGTITGDTSFGAPTEATGTPTWATSFRVTTDITENALRAERGLDTRISHHGGTTLAPQTARAGETIDQIVARYYLPGGQSMTAPLRAGIRSAVLAMYPTLATQPWPEGITLRLPHGEYIALHIGYIQNGASDTAELANKLLIR
ncbi:MAG: DUF4157 domain-containing protein [Myxococcales bacterium]|nr:DUF4157 domain-containing protein [Myxococcales bacterium]